MNSSDSSNNAANLTFWVILANVFVWTQSLTFGYVWDDFPTLVSNESLRDVTIFWKAFGNDFWELHHNPEQSGYWRPMVTILYAFVGQVCGFSSVVFHLGSVIFHTINALGVYCLGKAYLKDPRHALWAALLFSVHPMQSEAVSFMSAWPDLLSTMGGVWALVLLTSYSNRMGRFYLTLLPLAFSLLSKESGLSFVILALLYVWCFAGEGLKERLRISVLYIIVAFLYLYLHHQIAPLDSLAVGQTNFSLWSSAQRVCGVAIQYVFYMFLPVQSSPVKPLMPQGLFPIIWVLGICLSILYFILKKNHAERAGRLKVYLMVGFVLWLPVSFAAPIENHLGDRYMYALLIPFSFLMIELLKPFSVRLGLVMVFSVLCMVYSSKWKSDERLWSSVVQSTPLSWLAWNQHGQIFLNQNKLPEALLSFENSARLNPSRSEPKFNQSVVLYKMKDYEKSKNILNQYIAEQNEDAKAWDLLSSVNYAQKSYDEALSAQDRSLALAPDHWKYNYHRALTLLKLSRVPEALGNFKKALSYTRDRDLAWLIAQALESEGLWRDAKSYYAVIPPESNLYFQTQQKIQRLDQIIMIQGAP